MDDRKYIVLFLVLSIYSTYNVYSWFYKTETNSEISAQNENIDVEIDTASESVFIEQNNTAQTENVTVTLKKEPIPLFMRNACSVLEVFTIKPFPKRNYRPNDMNDGSNAIAVFGITVFLVVLAMNALLDVIKVKEEERIRKTQNQEGEKHESLAEFANKKPLRRESSKFGSQLFQITESDAPKDDQKKTRIPYTRGESTNSYLSEYMNGDTVPTSAEANNIEGKPAKRQSLAKLSGFRVGLLRRSSSPALPYNPDVQTLSRTRQSSTDSDDEDKGRRIRMIRRF